MKTLIVSGGNIDPDFALSLYKKDAYDRIIGVDNGLRFLYENHILPTHIVGDFDTAKPELVDYYSSLSQIQIRRFNPVKDSTDTQIAIELALELGSSSIVILGGTGSRLDHVLGNIQSMMLAKNAGVGCEMLDEHNRIRLISEDTMLEKDGQYGEFVSLIPLTTVVDGVYLKGFKYPLTNHTFTSTGSAGFGVSNEIMEEEAWICMRSGVFILIESRD
ncbi:MAG: thiamine diphosphokinase [Lachnospiraceae bacterium]|jgi:thiamine pyrophosphokinase|nr:thiamine diphosphokinase [Lachnospiraceae bacterium]